MKEPTVVGPVDCLRQLDRLLSDHGEPIVVVVDVAPEPHQRRLYDSLGVTVRVRADDAGMLEVAADSLVTTRLCKRANCGGEVEDVTGRFAGLCSYCKRQAVKEAAEAGTFGAAAGSQARARLDEINRQVTERSTVQEVERLLVAARRLDRARRSARRKQLEPAAAREYVLAFAQVGRKAGLLKHPS